MGLRQPFIVLLAFGLVSLLLFATLSDSYGVQRVSVDSTVSLRPNQPLLPTQPLAAAMQPPLGVPTILILSPMKSSAKFLPNFFKNVRSLTYAHAAVSIAFLHSDDNVGTLGPNSTTWDTYVD